MEEWTSPRQAGIMPSGNVMESMRVRVMAIAKAKGTNAQARIPAKEKAGSNSQKRRAKNSKMDNGRQCPKKIIERFFSFSVPCFFSSGWESPNI
jgi:hypothetical protein